MSVVINGTTGITNDGGYTGDGVVFADTTPANTLVTTTGGNVGIGTSSPGTFGKLAVVGHISTVNNGNRYRAFNDSGVNVLDFGVASLTGFGDSIGLNVATSTGVLAFGTNSTERARIDSSGNLLVGTTSTISGTQPAKTIVFNNTASQSCFQAGVGSSHTGAFAIGAFSTVQSSSGANVAIVVQSGNGSAVSANNFFVYTNGNVVNTNNSYGAISDAKLKENVIDATPKLDKLQQVRVVNYNLIGEEKKQIGVIAQELEQIFPGMVEETPDRDAEGNDLGTTTKSVKYSVFVPMLIKAIQEQQAIITALTARVAALDARLTSLEGTQP